MGLLMVALFWPPIRRSVGVAAQGLLAHLSLLFVPVGVGVMSHLDLLSEYGGRLLAILLLSTWAGLLATAWVFKALMPKATS
jgi:holin-like protein